MNNTHFGATHYDIHLDMKLDHSLSRIFQEMSLTELETLHQLCVLERTQILQSLALAVLKNFYAGYEGTILWFYTCTKKVQPFNVFEDKRCYKRIPIFYKNNVHFVVLPKNLFLRYSSPMWIRKKPQFSTIKP